MSTPETPVIHRRGRRADEVRKRVTTLCGMDVQYRYLDLRSRPANCKHCNGLFEAARDRRAAAEVARKLIE